MVQPIDVADLMSKVELVAKLNQKLKANADMDQRQAESVLKKKATAESEQAKQPEKTDLVIINADKEQDKEKKKFKQNKEDAEEEIQDELEDKNQPRLDIKA
ncbi:MAG: hypothetical protein ABIJ45_07225 [Candidatus Zixiibacteriota bacterium]